MRIRVHQQDTSRLVHNDDWAWEDFINGKKEIHLGFSCTHDCIVVTEDELYCPDCPEGQGLSDADIERALDGHYDPGDMDDDSE